MEHNTSVRDAARAFGEKESWVYQTLRKVFPGFSARTTDLDEGVLFALFKYKLENTSQELFDYTLLAEGRIVRYLRRGESLKAALHSGPWPCSEVIIAKKIVSPEQTISNTIVYAERVLGKDTGVREGFKDVLVEKYMHLFRDGKIKLINDPVIEEKVKDVIRQRCKSTR